MRIWVNVCFHYVESRLENFYKLINNLKELNAKIIINSNVNFDDSLPIEVSVLDDPFHLTWEHKKYMMNFLMSDYDYFVYVEGNTLLTKENLEYWIQTNSLFKRNNLNLIPSFHRVQIHDGKTYSLDPTNRVEKKTTIEVEGQPFVSMPEPYQGMFMMDKQDVKEHIHSEFFNLGQKGWYGIRESANIGNMYLNVPAGFNQRAVIPLNNFESTWIPHFGTDYHNDPSSPHAKILTEELFHEPR